MRHHLLRRIVTIALILVLLVSMLPLGTVVPEARAALLTYTITDLGTLGSDYSFAIDVNASGQVVGRSATATGEPRAFRTTANAPINPLTDGLDGLGADIYPQAMNDAGQVVGFSNAFGPSPHAFQFNSNKIIDLGTLVQGRGSACLVSNTAVGLCRST